MSMQVKVTMADGSSHDLTIANPDRIKWDRTAQKHKWPKFTDAPFLGLTFLAWSAMTRTGKTTDTWETFSDTTCLDVESMDEDGDTEVDPIRPGPLVD